MKYSHWLANIPGITSGKIFAILEAFSSAAELYESPKHMLDKVKGLTEEDISNIWMSRQQNNPDESYAKLMEQGISFVSYEHKDYPEKLRHIFNPPYCLYYKGKLPSRSKYAVAIVGARGRSPYGMEVARNLAGALAKAEIDVISGMARGIDKDAHCGALNENGTTYAVLGCGVDYCYPSENRYLYERIPQMGGVISEYPVGTAPLPRLFPARNRIISGLSDCVVVIEAKEKSGSLITADFAMEQGKDVYALPGRITDPLSKGCNSLIRQGAGVFLGIDEFVKEISQYLGSNYLQMDFRKNLLEKDESLVYSLLDFCPTAVGTLLDRTSFPLLELLEILERMVQKGVIREISPNYYAHTL